MIDIEYARMAFDKYLDQFDRENDKIKLKIIHTDGVVKSASEICKRMNLSDEDCSLAELIALLHDIGRFEQARRFDSFEPNTMDHATYGVQILFDDGMIRQFVKEDKWDKIIYEAIARHSRYDVGSGLSERELLHANIIRDADKLDNCRVKLEDSIEVLLGCSASEVGVMSISESVWDECMRRIAVHSEKRVTRMDYWAFYVAYLFDLNFRPSAQIVLENNYIKRTVDRIPYSNKETEKKMNILCRVAEDFMREMAEG